MENTKPTEKKSHLGVLTIILALLAVGGISFGATMAILGLNNQNDPKPNNINPVVASRDSVDFGTYRIEKYEDEPYYVFQKDFGGEYDVQTIDLFAMRETEEGMATLKGFRKTEVLDYEEYKNFCDTWGLEQKFDSSVGENYAVLSDYFMGAPIVEAELAEAQEEGSYIWLYYHDSHDGVTADIGGYAIIVPVSYEVDKVVPVPLYSEEEFDNIKNPGSFDPDDIVVKKPIVYLYPEAEREVSVKLGFPENLTVSYPHYNDGWKVIAKPNGELKDLESGRSLYALYYESLIDTKTSISDGFVVKGADVASFLEKKLAVLGLSEREAEEFIVFWLPALEANEYNYIRFENAEFINKNMPLIVSPAPDSTIRVWMSYKGLDAPIEVTEQKLETPTRDGFTVVEWGGAEIK